MDDNRSARRLSRPLLADSTAILFLLLLIVAFFWRLITTDGILARGDMFLYFYPYWQARAVALRALEVPLWNPNIFLGAPFLANSQAGVLYPLNWPLAYFETTTAIKTAIVFHASLGVVGMYLFNRRQLQSSILGATVGAVVFAFGGYMLAQIEHINQFQGLVWLPWLFLMWGEAKKHKPWNFLWLSLIWALQLLAGHTQTVFISGIGLGCWALLHLFIRRNSAGKDNNTKLSKSNRGVWSLVVVAMSAVWAGLLASAQLLPTVELARYSNRSRGLPDLEALSFSLRPQIFGRALLPAYDTPNLFTEYVAYIGVTALVMAVFTILFCFRERYVRALTILAALGLFFALGAYNPVYWQLVRYIIGFNLFRAPARWLVLTALASSGLVAIGFTQLAGSDKVRQLRPRQLFASLFVPLVVIVILGALSFLAPLAVKDIPSASSPSTQELIFWSVTVLVSISLLWSLHFAPDGWHKYILPLMAVVTVTELLLASENLPYNRLTVPQAWDTLRPTMTTLMIKEAAALPPDRYLSMSDTLFDPGDLRELEAGYGSILSEQSFYDFVIATKQKEILSPNLSMAWNIPTIDGFDGGILPLRAYTRYTALFQPGEPLRPDGRLREYLDEVPDLHWLRRANTRYIITDKVYDVWLGNIYYDLQFPLRLDTSLITTAEALPLQPFEATAVGLVGYYTDAADVPEGTDLAQVRIIFDRGAPATLTVRSGQNITYGLTAEPQSEIITWPTVPGQRVDQIQIAVSPEYRGELVIQGVTLIDQRTRAYMPTTLYQGDPVRLIHSGDVKIYEDTGVRDRAYLVCSPILVADVAEAMRTLISQPNSTVIESDTPFSPSTDCSESNPGTVEFFDYTPEQVIIEVNVTSSGAYLVLADADYPGWQVTVDGQAADILRADIMFRAINVPEGRHLVRFSYHSQPFQIGKAISLVTLAISFAGLWLWPVLRPLEPDTG